MGQLVLLKILETYFQMERYKILMNNRHELELDNQFVLLLVTKIR